MAPLRHPVYFTDSYTHTSTLLLLCFTLGFLLKTKLRALHIFKENAFPGSYIYSYLISFYFFYFFKPRYGFTRNTQVTLHFSLDTYCHLITR